MRRFLPVQDRIVAQQQRSSEGSQEEVKSEQKEELNKDIREWQPVSKALHQISLNMNE